MLDIDETRWYMHHFDDTDHTRYIIAEVLKIELLLVLGALVIGCMA